MQNKTFKKFLAITLAMSMTLGSAVTVFASSDPASSTTTAKNTATGEGTSTGHVDTNIVTFTIPGDKVANKLFDYYADPERLIDAAGTLADGKTTVTANSDGVYFANVATDAKPKGATYTSATGKDVSGYKITYDEVADGTYTYKAEVAGGWYSSEDVLTAIAPQIKKGDDVVAPKQGDTVTVVSTNDAAITEPKEYSVDGESTGLDFPGFNNEAAAGIYTYKEAVAAGWYNGGEKETGLTVKDSSDATVAPDDGDEIEVNATESEASYSSTSSPLKITVKNYVDATVSVAATVSSADNLIALAAKEKDLEDATKATLLLTLNVGTVSGNITTAGKTVVETVSAQKDNFKTVGTGNKFELQEKTATDNNGVVEWKEVNVTLSGKVNRATVSETDKAPTISLTWDVKAKDEKSSDSGTTETAPDASTATACYLGPDGDNVWLGATQYTGFTGEVTAVWVDGTKLASTDYEVNDTGWVKLAAPGSGKVILVVSGDKTYKVTAP